MSALWTQIHVFVPSLQLKATGTPHISETNQLTRNQKHCVLREGSNLDGVCAEFCLPLSPKYYNLTGVYEALALYYYVLF